MGKEKKQNIIILLLTVLIVFLAVKVFFLRADFIQKTKPGQITQINSGLKYRVNYKDNDAYSMHVGDIIGIDPNSYAFVDRLESSENTVFVSGIKKDFKEVNKENFLSLVSNDNKVILADNFCLVDWPSENNSDFYKNSSLSPGPYCASEKEVKILDRLIKQFQPGKFYVYYSSEIYLELISGFLQYLEELSIDYQLKQINEK